MGGRRLPRGAPGRGGTEGPGEAAASSPTGQDLGKSTGWGSKPQAVSVPRPPPCMKLLELRETPAQSGL